MYLKAYLPLATDLSNSATPPFNPGLGCSGDPRLLFQGSSAWETDKPYMCSSCGKRRKRMMFCDQLPLHVVLQCKKELSCLKCMRRYSHWGNLRIHMNYYCQMEPLYSCPYCTHKARMGTALKYHMAREHSGVAASEEIHLNLRRPRRRSKRGAMLYSKNFDDL
ncbi:uncharacterized protein LOC143376375 isoform X2 [Andrena cerasifolii]|uniref:uncharacterized protein LOC143376375 isoform X2 n=1 Tax=Andrena cerasifolii TaxID=2819439 RepID=UPI0040380FFD